MSHQPPLSNCIVGDTPNCRHQKWSCDRKRSERGKQREFDRLQPSAAMECVEQEKGEEYPAELIDRHAHTEDQGGPGEVPALHENVDRDERKPVWLQVEFMTILQEWAQQK